MPNAQTSLDLINQFLSPIRNRMDKEAAADNSTSFMDTAAASPEAQAKQQAGATSQSTLGVEQSQEAAKGSGTTHAPTEKPNADGDEKQYADSAGTQTMSTDDSVLDNGNIGPTRAQVITQEQKMARASRLGASILGVIEASFSKTAACGEDCEGCDECAGGYDDGPQADGADGGETGDEYSENMESDEDKEASAAFDKIASVAQAAASDYYESFMVGMLKRAQDEHELSQSNLPPELLQRMGGVAGILDKVAMEDPGSVLPEGIVEEGAPVEGAPAEGAPTEGGGPDLDAVASELDAAGVTPEALESAMADIAKLQEAGVPEEEIAQALQELDGGGEEGAPAPEAAPMPLPEEAGMMAEASDHRGRIDAIKAFITR